MPRPRNINKRCTPAARPLLRKGCRQDGHGRYEALLGASVAGLKDLIAWWTGRSEGPWHVVGTVEEADELPKVLPRKGAILVGSARSAKWLAFDCPCEKG